MFQCFCAHYFIYNSKNGHKTNIVWTLWPIYVRKVQHDSEAELFGKTFPTKAWIASDERFRINRNEYEKFEVIQFGSQLSRQQPIK